MDTLGRILTVDLTIRSITIEPLDEAAARHYLGGRGLNAWQAREHIGPEVDAYSPDNVLLLTCGLITGTELPVSSRLQLAARSPQTNLLGASNVGGHFGATLRQNGYHMLRLVGAADSPVMLWIDEQGAEIHDAAHLWGLDPRAVGERVTSEREGWVMAIGTAGENLVRYASIITSDGHAAGRTGMGAVMGSKRVKAIAVARPAERSIARGSARDRDLATLAREYALTIRQSERYDLYSTTGNSAYLNWTNDLGMLGTRNFQTGQYEHSEKLNGTVFTPYVKRHKTCHRCPVHCRAEIRIDHGRYANLVGERPDIEPLMAFGPRLGVDDPEFVLYLYNLTNVLGVDVISLGGVLAFAVDLYERGIITSEDTQGVPLSWGNVEAFITMTHQIAAREGFGAVLAEGVRRAAHLIGRGADAYAYHSKGLELPGYDPRAAQGTALSFAISNRGADYASVYPSLEFFWTPEQAHQILGSAEAVDPSSPAGKGALVRYSYIVSAVLDALGFCKVPVLSVVGDFSLEPEARLISTYTGWEITPAQLFEIGARIVTAERLINLAYGMSPQDDTLPALFLKTPMPAGPSAGRTVVLDEMLRDFYAAMGWDSEGRPLADAL